MKAYRWFALILSSLTIASVSHAGDVTGRVEMPAVCSPSVSPAVVNLERLDARIDVAQPATGRG